MKVIAIKDAPVLITKSGFTRKGKFYDKAYSRGDVFEVYDSPNNHIPGVPNDYLIIYHDKLEINMDVDPKNFITLREYREKQLNKLLSK
jgi:hypothetical protein